MAPDTHADTGRENLGGAISDNVPENLTAASVSATKRGIRRHSANGCLPGSETSDEDADPSGTVSCATGTHPWPTSPQTNQVQVNCTPGI